MSTLKYFVDAPGTPRTPEGYPLRGNHTPLLKADEWEDLPLSFDAKVETFRTDDPEQLKRYTEVLDRIANGLYERAKPDLEQWDPDAKCWIILMRWVEIKGELPGNIHQARRMMGAM